MKKLFSILLLGLLIVPFALEAKHSPLIKAIQKEDMNLFNEAINTKGVDVNERDKDKSTPLIMASEKNQNQMVEILLSKGAKPKLANKYGMTALMKASENSSEIVRKLLVSVCGSNELLDKIIKASMAEVGEKDPIYFAAPAVNIRLAGKKSPDNKKGAEAITFTEEEQLKIEELRTYINMKDDGRYTALMIALEKYNESAAILLIHAGTNLTVKGDWGEDAAKIAAENKLSDYIQTLIAKKLTISKAAK